MGYLTPELTKTGKPTTCADVFAFGALLLEVACGGGGGGCYSDVMDPKLMGKKDEMAVVVVEARPNVFVADAP
ncbi:hypothetical protein Nepgr_020895 [Nepenthes gracilis]|uniref:Protein kinase domain-containing protein n=1 Tax=Nepenthes gracilis TaxID=150966 RepID=A0AAD3SYK5_NEPGR|nr:hypothetical protein Nepgr_020895 [Nepenthes gracilis]